jgi:hypothetical protein
MADESRSRLEYYRSRLAKWVRLYCLGGVFLMLTAFLKGGTLKVRLDFWVALAMDGLFLVSVLFCLYGCCAVIWYAANAVGEQTNQVVRSRLNPPRPPG